MPARLQHHNMTQCHFYLDRHHKRVFCRQFCLTNHSDSARIVHIVAVDLYKQYYEQITCLSICTVCFQLAETCLPVHDNVKRKIAELFASGVRRVCEYRTLLEDYIKHDLFSGQPIPPLSDARFWPSNRYILGCISRLSSKSRSVSCHCGICTIQRITVNYYFEYYEQCTNLC